MQGKNVLVTGAARRVGAHIVEHLHAQGASVLVHYNHSHTEALALQARLEARRPDSIFLFSGDLLDPDTIEGLAFSCEEAFNGQLDGLVNNASSFFPTPFGQIEEKDWVDLMGSNLKAPLFLSQALFPMLKAQKGAIVNLADIHAERPLEHHVVYTPAKAGMVALTRSLALECAPDVRVNAVAPGVNLWPESEAIYHARLREEMTAQIPLQRTGQPSDIAETVSFLLAQAPYITGQIIAVDGGRGLRL